MAKGNGGGATAQRDFFASLGLPGQVAAAVEKIIPKKRKRELSPAQKKARKLFGDRFDHWPHGYYRALSCRCSVSIGPRGVYKTHCAEHVDVSEAYFDEPVDWAKQRDENAKERQAYCRLPRAEMPTGYEGLFDRLFVRWNRTTMGDPKEWKDKVFTLDAPFDCGCQFVARHQTFHGVWSDEANFWLTKTWTKWVAVRVGSCGKPQGLCYCETFPIFAENVKIGLVLKKELAKQNQA